MILFNVRFLLHLGLICLVNPVSMKLMMSPDNDKRLQVVYKALTKILNKCFSGNLNPLVVSNMMNQQLEHYFNLKYSMSVILLDEYFDNFVTEKQWTNYYPNVSTFVLVPKDYEKFYYLMRNIYFSVWGENQPTFILINWHTCRYVLHHLQTLWIGDYLSGLLLCYNDRDNIVQVYTFNPYADRAPNPWIRVWNNQTWTLYRRNYQEGGDMCLNLIYDKTKYLNGYKVSVVAQPDPSATWEDHKIYNISSLTQKVSFVEAQFNINLFQIANLTPHITYKLSYDYTNYDFNANFIRPKYYSVQVRTSYPFRQSSLVIITYKRPFLTIREKIQLLYSTPVILLTMVSFGTLFIALMLTKKQSWLSVMMELMRLLVATGLIHPLDGLPIRVYLFGIFWLVIIINATFTGKLLEFLTKPERHNIDSIADIKKFGYRILTNPVIFDAMNTTFTDMGIPADKITVLGTEMKPPGHLDTSTLATIIVGYSAYKIVFAKQWHTSGPIGFLWESYGMTLRITDRVNDIASRYAESGLYDYWMDCDTKWYKENLTNTEGIETSPQTRFLTIADLLFIFKFLAIGLGIASGVFLMEIAIGRKYNKRFCMKFFA